MTTQQSRKVAVIGAGPSGLVFLRNFLKQGHSVVCFEKQGDVGGMWRMDGINGQNGYVSLNEDGSVDSTFESLLMNASKYSEFASDDLPSKTFLPDSNQFYDRQQFLDAIERSATKFNLTPHIRFNHEITKLDKLTNVWNVSYTNQDGQHKQEDFEFVMACIGFRFPRFPNIPNMADFTGVGIHSSQVRLESKMFTNKTVLVVGGSHSGIDMVYWSLKNNAKKVFLSLNKMKSKSYWIMDRYTDENPKKPFEFGFNRYTAFDRTDIFKKLTNAHAVALHKATPNAEFTLPRDAIALNHPEYILKQKELGRLQLLDEIDSMLEHGVRCIDGCVVEGVDMVVYCTGFEMKYPWLSDLWPEEKQMRNALYYHMLPAEEELQGLAFSCPFIGKGSFFPVYENQSKWLCKFWLTRRYNNNGSLYSEEEIQKMNTAIVDFMEERKDVPMNFIPNFYVLNDSLAQEIGCLPPDYKELLRKSERSDIELGIALMMSPLVLSPQYRLRGDNVDESAADFLIGVTKYTIGEDKFVEMVEDVLTDDNAFFDKYGLSREKYVLKPYMKAFMHSV